MKSDSHIRVYIYIYNIFLYIISDPPKNCISDNILISLQQREQSLNFRYDTCSYFSNKY